MDASEVTFRRLTDDDLPMLHRWLNDPDVVRWWEGDDVTWRGIVETYGSGCVDQVEHWLGLVDGRPAGWIQCYATESDPDEAGPWWALGVDRSAAGIDYMVSADAGRGRGLGSAMIEAFVLDVVAELHPEWSQVCAAPYRANEASWRALARAGFRHVADIESPDDPDGPARLMVLDLDQSRRRSARPSQDPGNF